MISYQSLLLIVLKWMQWHNGCSGTMDAVAQWMQWHSQTFSDGRAHYCYKILSIIYKHAGSYVHLLKGVVCMKMHTNSS